MRKCNHSNPDCLRCRVNDCEEKKKLYEAYDAKHNNPKNDKEDDNESSTYLSLLSFIP